jgi:hypothetical protein
MRTPTRVLLALTAALAAAHPAAATPSAHVRTSSERSFEMHGGYAYDSVSLRFRHLRGSLGAGTHSGGASGESWEACLYAWGSSASFYGCGTPTAVTFDVPPGTATGRLRFTLRQQYWTAATAVADLTLTDSGAVPGAGYETNPYGTHVAPAVTTTRQAVLKGTVKVTYRRGTKTATRTYQIADVPVRFVERVTASAGAHVV